MLGARVQVSCRDALPVKISKDGRPKLHTALFSSEFRLLQRTAKYRQCEQRREDPSSRVPPREPALLSSSPTRGEAAWKCRGPRTPAIFYKISVKSLFRIVLQWSRPRRSMKQTPAAFSAAFAPEPNSIQSLPQISLSDVQTAENPWTEENSFLLHTGKISPPKKIEKTETEQGFFFCQTVSV